jgi:hypothetical protein
LRDIYRVIGRISRSHISQRAEKYEVNERVFNYLELH